MLQSRLRSPSNRRVLAANPTQKTRGTAAEIHNEQQQHQQHEMLSTTTVTADNYTSRLLLHNNNNDTIFDIQADYPAMTSHVATGSSNLPLFRTRSVAASPTPSQTAAAATAGSSGSRLGLKTTTTTTTTTIAPSSKTTGGSMLDKLRQFGLKNKQHKAKSVAAASASAAGDGVVHVGGASRESMAVHGTSALISADHHTPPCRQLPIPGTTNSRAPMTSSSAGQSPQANTVAAAAVQSRALPALPPRPVADTHHLPQLPPSPSPLSRSMSGGAGNSNRRNLPPRSLMSRLTAQQHSTCTSGLDATNVDCDVYQPAAAVNMPPHAARTRLSTSGSSSPATGSRTMQQQQQQQQQQQYHHQLSCDVSAERRGILKPPAGRLPLTVSMSVPITYHSGQHAADIDTGAVTSRSPAGLTAVIHPPRLASPGLPPRNVQYQKQSSSGGRPALVSPLTAVGHCYNVRSAEVTAVSSTPGRQLRYLPVAPSSSPAAAAAGRPDRTRRDVATVTEDSDRQQQRGGIQGIQGSDTQSPALLEAGVAVPATPRFSPLTARQTRLQTQLTFRDVDELQLSFDEHVEEPGLSSPDVPHHQDKVDDDCFAGSFASAAEYSVGCSAMSELDRITQREDVRGLDSERWNQLESVVDLSANSTTTNIDRNSDDLDLLESCSGNSNDEGDNDVDDSTLKHNNNNSNKEFASSATAIDSRTVPDIKQQQQQQNFVRHSFTRHSTNSFQVNRPSPAVLPVPSAPVAPGGNAARRPTDNVDTLLPAGAFVRGSSVRSSLPAHPGTPGIASRQPTSLAAAVDRGGASGRIIRRPRTNTSSQTVPTSDGQFVDKLSDGSSSCDVTALDDTGNMSTTRSGCHGDVGAAGGASRLLRRLVSPHQLQSPSRKQQQQEQQQMSYAASPAAAAAVSCCNTELSTGERLSNYSKVEQSAVDSRLQQQQQHQLVGRRRSANTAPAARSDQSPATHQISNVRHRSPQSAAAAAGAVNRDRYNAAGANSRGCIRLPSPPTNATAVAGGSGSDNSLIITNRSASLTTQNSVSDGHQYANVATVLHNKNVVGNDVIAPPARPRLLSSASASRVGFMGNVGLSPASSGFPVQHSISPSDVKPSRCIPLLGPVLRSPVRAATGLLTPTHSSSVLLSQSKSPFSSSPEDNVHGSLLSLGSNSSSAAGCLSAEELKAQEVWKLRQELLAAQNKIISLSNHLSTNAQVVFAFEQSLTNMTVRLQRLATNTNQKDVELNELRATIESLRQQSKEKFSLYNHRLQCSSASNLQPLSLLDRHTSIDSINSEASTISQHSCTTSDKKAKKHKNWLSSVSKALNWRKKRLGTATDVESETSSLYTDPSLTLSVPDQLHASSVPSSPIRTSISSSSSSALTSDRNDMEILQRQLHEKDMRLTDVQLEALSSAHRLQQMHDAMNRMKSEITSLRGDNERLHHIITQKGINVSTPVGSAAVQCSPHSQRSTSVQCISLADQSASLDFLLADGASSRSCQTLKLLVQLKSCDATSNTQNMSSHVMSSKSLSNLQIGELRIDSKTDWDKLHQIVASQFQSYLLRLEPETGLGLNEGSIQCFQTGEVKYGKEIPRPELLPCGYLIGDTNSILITLHGAERQCVDSLSFETLIPKPIVQRYISLLADHRRLILCGSSGTGKTYLAHKLAEHLVLRCGKQANEISVFNIDSQSGRELRQYLTSIAEKCEQQLSDLPAVIILDNLHHITSPLGDIFNCLINVDLQTSPYIIGTMNQSTSSSTNLQLHHNFRWILCANHMEPVNGFLGRYLRRRLAATEIGTPSGETMERIVEWIPRVWQHLNRLLETHNSNDVTVGPRLFLSCPMEVSEVPTWFIDLWNYSLVPYMLEAVREGVQTFGARASWEDPTDWIISTCPWTERASVDLSGFLRIRPEDVGCEAATVASSSCRSNTAMDIHDPLMNMLLRLQDAANYPSTSTSSEIDTSIE